MDVLTKNELTLPAAGLDLAATLQCGQTFSWRQTDGGAFLGVAGRRAVCARQQGDALLLASPGGAALDAADEAYWRHHFALDEDYAALHTAFAADGTLAACVASCPGIRVLNQPFFDTLLAFIISQQNNIPRITGIAERLRRQFGPRLVGGEHGYPAPETLAALRPEDLAGIRAGFRAKYLIDAAQRVAGGEVSEAALRQLDDDGARRLLCRIKGVGPKVADCVLLFSLGRKGVAPMDVWMKRAVQQHFGGRMPPCAAGAAGIAQQYIFHWMRTGAGEKG